MREVIRVSLLKTRISVSRFLSFYDVVTIERVFCWKSHGTRVARVRAHETSKARHRLDIFRHNLNRNLPHRGLSLDAGSRVGSVGLGAPDAQRQESICESYSVT